MPNANTTLTIGSGITVHGQNGDIGYDPNIGGSLSVGIVNQGTISADTSGDTITLNDSSWSGSGPLSAQNGGLINIPTWLAVGTITLASGGGLTGGSELNGVTINGPWTIDGANHYFIENGLTLNGAVTLGDSSGYGYLNFQGTQTLGGTSTITFGSTNTTNALLVPNANTTLTIGSGITVHGQNGYIGFDPNIGGSSSVGIINQGAINADTNGDTITLNDSSWSGSGTLSALNGGLINIPNWLRRGYNHARLRAAG